MTTTLNIYQSDGTCTTTVNTRNNRNPHTITIIQVSRIAATEILCVRDETLLEGKFPEGSGHFLQNARRSVFSRFLTEKEILTVTPQCKFCTRCICIICPKIQTPLLFREPLFPVCYQVEYVLHETAFPQLQINYCKWSLSLEEQRERSNSDLEGPRFGQFFHAGDMTISKEQPSLLATPGSFAYI